MFKFENPQDKKWYEIPYVVKRFVDAYHNCGEFMAYLPCLLVLRKDTREEKVDVVMRIRREFIENCGVSLDELVEFERELRVNLAFRKKPGKAFGNKNQEILTAVFAYLRKRTETPPEDFIAELML